MHHFFLLLYPYLQLIMIHILVNNTDFTIEINTINHFLKNHAEILNDYSVSN